MLRLREYTRHGMGMHLMLNAHTRNTSRLFAKQGYRVALVARGADSLNRLAGEITNEGGEVT